VSPVHAMDNLPLNPFDIAVIAVLVISGFLAYMRGMVHELLAIGGWVGAILATIYGFNHVRPYARQMIPIDLAADVAAGAAIFVVTMIVLSLLTRAISRRVQESALNVVDRSLGFVFGLVRGAFVVCLAYIGISWFWSPAEQPEWMLTARSMPLIIAGADRLREAMPDDTRKRTESVAEQAKERAQTAADAERLLRELVRPAAESGAAREEPGYDRRQRQGLERLIEGAQ
jgi:membrane protein required for colicin V production